jgi:hypothetical protein
MSDLVRMLHSLGSGKVTHSDHTENYNSPDFCDSHNTQQSAIINSFHSSPLQLLELPSDFDSPYYQHNLAEHYFVLATKRMQKDRAYGNFLQYLTQNSQVGAIDYIHQLHVTQADVLKPFGLSFFGRKKKVEIPRELAVENVLELSRQIAELPPQYVPIHMHQYAKSWYTGQPVSLDIRVDSETAYAYFDFLLTRNPQLVKTIFTKPLATLPSYFFETTQQMQVSLSALDRLQLRLHDEIRAKNSQNGLSNVYSFSTGERLSNAAVYRLNHSS